MKIYKFTQASDNYKKFEDYFIEHVQVPEGSMIHASYEDMGIGEYEFWGEAGRDVSFRWELEAPIDFSIEIPATILSLVSKNINDFVNHAKEIIKDSDSIMTYFVQTYVEEEYLNQDPEYISYILIDSIDLGNIAGTLSVKIRGNFGIEDRTPASSVNKFQERGRDIY